MPGFKLEDFPEAETREQVFQARNGGSDRPSGDFSREEKMKRASAYVAKMDPAIEGAGGDHRTYCAGAVVARDFDLSVEDAMEVLRPWNTRCQPPWVEHDLRKKIENALEYGTSTIGSKFEGLNGGGPRVVGSDPGWHEAEEESRLRRLAVQAEAIVSEHSDPLAKPTDKTIRAVSMATVQSENVAWLWFPRIPLRKVTLIEGDPGLGKSWITLAIATAVSLGQGLPDCEPTDPANVLLLSAEDGLGDTVKPRLETLGADVSRVFAIEKPITLDWAGCKDLHRLIGDHSPSVVIIDPLFAYVGAKTDIAKANETRAITARLAAIANYNGCSILAIRHLTKGGRDKSIYRGVGSIDLTAACRSVLLVGADPNDHRRRAVCQIKNNLAPMADPIGYSVEEGQFFWTGRSDLSAQAMLASEHEGGALPIEEALEFLQEILKDGPIPQREVWQEAHQAGISERTLKRAKAKLSVVSKKDGFSRQWVWRFPEGGHQGGHQK